MNNFESEVEYICKILKIPYTNKKLKSANEFIRVVFFKRPSHDKILDFFENNSIEDDCHVFAFKVNSHYIINVEIP